ncbi:MAG: YezD family protein [Planctomycetia bacterium]
MSTDATRQTTQQADSRIDPGLRRIGDALTGLRYGSVLAIVQDGVIVQIERTEKTRLDKPVPVTPSRR